MRSATLDGFDLLLGAQRGSAERQAQRDVEERCACLRAAERFAHSAGTTRESAVRCFTQHSAGACEREHPGYRQVLDELIDGARANGSRFLVAVLGAGDPPGYPGLTLPAQDALCEIIDGALLTAETQTIIEGLFAKPQPLSYYQRLDCVCRALGERIDASFARNSAYAHLATVMARAPASALDGPLRCWVDAFERRLRARRSFSSERERLAIAAERLAVAHPTTPAAVSEQFARIAALLAGG